MIRLLRLVCLGLLLIPTALFAASPGFDAAALKITWEVGENVYRGQPQFLSAFTFSNTGATPLPASGWAIYFNFVRQVHPDTVTGGIQIAHVNGDLFRLSPRPGFTGLAPGASLRVEWISDNWAVNFTDAPIGLYWLADDAPDKPQPIANYSIVPSTQPNQARRTATDQLGFVTPEETYAKNRLIALLPPAQLPKILPTPKRAEELPGAFTLDHATTIAADPLFASEADTVAAAVEAALGVKPEIKGLDSGVTRNRIRLVRDAALTGEAYKLLVSPDGVTITAGASEGIFYGTQSLKQLWPADVWASPRAALSIPAIAVEDAPRFAHRALFLDVARNFQRKEDLLKVIDLMALYKLNVLHLHLTDDEGWRIEIAALPELTAVGSRRGHTLDHLDRLQPSFGSGPISDRLYGSGHYTRAEFVEILRFATARHIRVIPEIETPGHARAAVKAMEARAARLTSAGQAAEAAKYRLQDPGDTSKHESVQLWNDNVMDVSLPSTYAFLGAVADELIAMYKEASAPLATLHFGGDEVPAGVWEKSPAFVALRKDHPELRSADDLWYYYYGRVAELLRARGLALSGWEEVAMRKTLLDGKKITIPNPDFAARDLQIEVWNNVIGWNAEDLAYKLANAGYKVVLANVTNLYFDMAYEKAFDEPGYYWGSYIDVDRVFSFIPYDYYKNTFFDRLGQRVPPSAFAGKERLTDYGKTNVVGIEGLLWGENMLGPGRVEYMLLPKLLGLAERAWAADPAWATEKDPARSEAEYGEAWSVFANRLGQRELPRLDAYDGGFLYRLPPPGAVRENGSVLANVQLPGLAIRFTSDGSEPTATSRLYTSPIAEKGMIKLRTFDRRGRGSRVTTVENR